MTGASLSVINFYWLAPSVKRTHETTVREVAVSNPGRTNTQGL